MAEIRITSGRAHRNRCAAFVEDSRGATAVEFAIVAAPFLALIIALIQTFLVFFAQSHLESVVQQASRQIMTGQTQSQTSGDTVLQAQTAFQQTVCNQIVILFSCSGMMVDVQVATSWSATNTSAPTLTYNSQGAVTNTWQFNPGNAGDIVVVRVMYLWPVFMGPLGFTLSNQPNGSRLLMSTAAFQNEPAS
jgi:Flp pilus assembly protein TadG